MASDSGGLVGLGDGSTAAGWADGRRSPAGRSPAQTGIQRETENNTMLMLNLGMCLWPSAVMARTNRRRESQGGSRIHCGWVPCNCEAVLVRANVACGDVCTRAHVESWGVGGSCHWGSRGCTRGGAFARSHRPCSVRLGSRRVWCGCLFIPYTR
eukprot:3563824-Prymnesium_polylepis.1